MKHLVAAGLLALLSSTVAANPHHDASGALVRGPHSCGTPPSPAPWRASQRATERVNDAAPAAPRQRTVFLNRRGGTYTVTSGATHAATNAVNEIISGGGPGTFVIAPLETSFRWPAVVSCLQEKFRPYDVNLVETEPASGDYLEAVVGGTGQELGYGPMDAPLGIAAADNFCSVTETGIAFTFSLNFVGIPNADDELCNTAAHEIGHLLSLEHEAEPLDSMSYISFSRAGTKSFVDVHASCGTTANDTFPCYCPATVGDDRTNSAQRLREHVGARPLELLPPSLEVERPGDEGTVRPSFDLVATARDEAAMDGVTVLLDGVESDVDAEVAGATYTFSFARVPLGPHVLEVRAADMAGNVTTTQVAIEVTLLATGETCARDQDCAGALCGTFDDAAFCTQSCDASAACPSGFRCDDVGAVCVPAREEGGGCGVAGSFPGAGLLVASLGALAVLRRRRAA